MPRRQAVFDSEGDRGPSRCRAGAPKWRPARAACGCANLTHEGGASAMSMIDYDARPVTPQVLLVGHRASSVGYSIRDFLSRNGVPYEWVDVDDAGRVGVLLPAGG